METINGVSFKDYACANANIVGGMPIEKVCQVLGIEQPVWEETVEGWNSKMAELTPEDMAFYGEAFTNPKQGKFADVEGGAAGPEVVLAKYPEWSDTLKMEKYMQHAANVGVDINFEKDFDITLTQYTQLAAHWNAYFHKNIMDIQAQPREIYTNGEWEEAQRLFDFKNAESEKWDAHYQEKYGDASANIGGDIEF